MSLFTFIAPLALVSAPPSDDAPTDRLVRLTAGLGAVVEVHTHEQAMLNLVVTPSLRFDALLVGLEAGLHTTVTNDQKSELGVRLGGALDLTPSWEGSATLDLGWRQQTKSRLAGDLFGGPVDPGVTHEHGYAGATLGLHHRSQEGGFVYGLELFARFDLDGGTRVADPDGGELTFGGTTELGLTFKAGLDVLFGR